MVCCHSCVLDPPEAKGGRLPLPPEAILSPTETGRASKESTGGRGILHVHMHETMDMGSADKAPTPTVLQKS